MNHLRYSTSKITSRHYKDVIDFGAYFLILSPSSHPVTTLGGSAHRPSEETTQPKVAYDAASLALIVLEQKINFGVGKDTRALITSWLAPDPGASGSRGMTPQSDFPFAPTIALSPTPMLQCRAQPHHSIWRPYPEHRVPDWRKESGSSKIRDAANYVFVELRERKSRVEPPRTLSSAAGCHPTAGRSARVCYQSIKHASHTAALCGERPSAAIVYTRCAGIGG